MNTASLIQSRIESNEPQDTILKILRKYDGKRLTKRHAVEVNKAMAIGTCRISKRWGMTDIEWGNYESSGGVTGGTLLMADSDSNVFIDVSFILERNKSQFSAKDKRNEIREKALASRFVCAALDVAIQRYVDAKAVMETLLLNEVFEPDRDFLEKQIA